MAALGTIATRTGVSAQVGEALVAADDTQALESLAGYLARTPLASKARVPRRPAGGDLLEEEPAKKRRCSASWARLIAKVFDADPLTCGKCRRKLKIVAYLHDHVAIKQILDYLGLSPQEATKSPPAVHEVRRVPVDEEGASSRRPQEGGFPAFPPGCP